LIPFSLAPAAWTILGLILVVSVLGLKAAPQLIERNLLRPYQVVRGKSLAPLITHGFVHANFGHLIFNSLSLFFFGPKLELDIGSSRFVMLYFIGLLVGSLGTVIKHKDDPNYSSLGASGAILAVLFASIVYHPLDQILLYYVIAIPAVLYAFGYLAYTWWASKQNRGRINHDAHLDGAITGLIFVGVTDYDAWRHAFAVVAAAIN
jgi:membrane associated rhomboid family serine protease